MAPCSGIGPVLQSRPTLMLMLMLMPMPLSRPTTSPSPGPKGSTLYNNDTVTARDAAADPPLRKPAARHGGPGLTDAAMARVDAATCVTPAQSFGRLRFLRALRQCDKKPVERADTLITLALLPT